MRNSSPCRALCPCAMTQWKLNTICAYTLRETRFHYIHKFCIPNRPCPQQWTTYAQTNAMVGSHWLSLTLDVCSSRAHHVSLEQIETALVRHANTTRKTTRGAHNNLKEKAQASKRMDMIYDQLIGMNRVQCHDRELLSKEHALSNRASTIGPGGKMRR